MPEAGGNARLNDLEARWRFDRSPRIFLQLADELRRAGNVPRAIQVLQEGLAVHPESISGRVALGRAQLDAGELTTAAETLELALARDPAQIVANKLLIETWIQIGDSARARERLDIYRILQERDSEIDNYERRIAGMERTERMAAVIEMAGASPAPAAPAAPSGPAPMSETAAASSDLGEPESARIESPPDGQRAVETESDLFDLGPTRRLTPLELLPELAPVREALPGAPFDLGMPFGTIHEPGPSSARILQFFRREALFVALPAAAAAARAISELEMVPEIEIVPEISRESVPELSVPPMAIAEPPAVESPIEAAPAIAQVIAEVPLEPFVEPASAPLLAAEPIAPAAALAVAAPFEAYSTTGFAEEVERESLVEPLADVLERAGVDAELLPPIEMQAEDLAAEPEALAATPVQAASAEAPSVPAAIETIAGDAAPSAGPSAVPSAGPSATLARLYLEQGHLGEAEAEFRRVLAARPDDEAANMGLRDVAARRERDETASGWGAVAAAAPRPSRPAGLSQRKVETLRSYLERIRRGRQRVHVS